MLVVEALEPGEDRALAGARRRPGPEFPLDAGVIGTEPGIGQCRVLRADAGGQEDRVGRGEHGRGDPGGVHQGQGEALRYDGDVVGMA